MGDLIALTIYDEHLYEEALEHYPGGKDHDQMKHGAWSPLSGFHKPQVHVKGAKKYNHLTLAAKQKLLQTLAGGAQAKAKAELVKTLGAHAASVGSSGGGGGSTGSGKTGGKKASTGTKKAATKKAAAAVSASAEHELMKLEALPALKGTPEDIAKATQIRDAFHQKSLKQITVAKGKLSEEGYNKLVDAYNKYASSDEHQFAQWWIQNKDAGVAKTVGATVSKAIKQYPAQASTAGVKNTAEPIKYADVPKMGGSHDVMDLAIANNLRAQFYNETIAKLADAKANLPTGVHQALVDKFNAHMQNQTDAQWWMQNHANLHDAVFNAPDTAKTAAPKVAAPKAAPKVEPAPKIEPPHELMKLESAPALKGSYLIHAEKIRAKFYEAATKQIAEAKGKLSPEEYNKLVDAFNQHMQAKTSANWWLNHKDTLKTLVPDSAEKITGLPKLVGTKFGAAPKPSYTPPPSSSTAATNLAKPGSSFTTWKTADSAWKGSEFNQKSVTAKDSQLSDETKQVKLTATEKSQILNYSQSGYISLNQQLRAPNAQITPSNQKQMEALDTALAKGHAPDDMHVYRGMGNTIWSKLQAAGVGGHILEKGYSSSSINPEKSFTGVKATIRVPKGSAGLYIKPLSGHSHEEEWLMPRGSTFKILSLGEGGGHKYAVLELVPPDEAALIGTTGGGQWAA